MTSTLDRSETAAQAGVNSWLSAFEDAPVARDVERAAALFLPQSFWRDLVAFSWNLTTAEGPEGVADLLRSALDSTDPSGFTASEEPTEEGGITTAWIAFETAVGRGRGLLRLRDGKAFTLLTSLEELKGFEEPARGRRPRGAEHGADRNRTTWLEGREKEAAELGYTRQPYVVVVGGGQGGIALGARLRSLGVEAIIVEKNA